MKFLLNVLAVLSMVWCQKCTGESITGWDSTYQDICLKATTDPWYFQNFRSLTDYTHVLEIGGGGTFADYLHTYASNQTMEKLSVFKRLEEVGNPSTHDFTGIGKFSGTTLRYIVIADHIKKLFSLPATAKIVEIGAGFGGQCFILSHLQPFSKYYIYDLPNVERLIEKMMTVLSVQNVIYLPLETGLPEETVDLVISNYAYSECDRTTQLDYFERVIKKATRGYIIYNQIAGRVYGLNFISPHEFVTLLQNNGKNAKIYAEPIATDVDNLLIVWNEGCSNF